ESASLMAYAFTDTHDHTDPYNSYIGLISSRSFYTNCVFYASCNINQFFFQRILCCVFFFFFFQAEDGIRDYKVTGVQTCALPILAAAIFFSLTDSAGVRHSSAELISAKATVFAFIATDCPVSNSYASELARLHRSEERRVGKECRSRWSSVHCKKQE